MTSDLLVRYCAKVLQSKLQALSPLHNEYRLLQRGLAYRGTDPRAEILVDKLLQG